MKKSKGIIISVLGVVLLLVLLIGVSYAAFSYSVIGDQINSITIGGLTMTYEEDNNIEINNALYIDDEAGKVQTNKFDFTIQAKSKFALAVNYEIAAVKETDSTLKDSYVTMYLTEGTPEVLVMAPKVYTPIADKTTIGSPAGSMVLHSDSFSLGQANPNESRTYTFRMWINTTIPTEELLTPKTFKVRIDVNARQMTSTSSDYKETILNGADPELDSGMIPIYYDGNVAKKADIKTEWYNYSNKEWANVVMVNESTRSTYQSATPGTVINEADVLGYLVWIPRYKYKLFNVEGATISPQSIEIVFENKSTAKSNGSTNGTYLTHPGFTFGSEELNGMWVGKFETTGDATTPTIKPNITSLRNQNVSEQFETSRKFTNSTYGLTGDSHMMKNSEWSSVVYLSHSIYGKNSEIRLNNNSNYITGCGASADNRTESATCEIAYGNSVTYPQSTTGNITGIYDMSGGAWERTMSNYANTISDSGFTTLPATKYYDLYTSGSNASNYLGHALGETNGWYGDYTSFVSTSDPWSGRGGYYNDGAYAGGSSFLSYSYGNAYSNHSFRLVRAGA